MPIPPNGPRRLGFGLFEVDLSARELYKRGVLLHLQDQPFQVLTLLLGRPGGAVSREELRARLWPDGTCVDFDEGLNTAIKKLRFALGDSADCGYQKLRRAMLSASYRTRSNIVKRLAPGDLGVDTQAGPGTDGCREAVRSQCVRIISPYGSTGRWTEAGHPDGRKGLKDSRPMRRAALGNTSDESTRRSGEIVVVNRKE
jgi:hypothetical protein